MGVALWLAGWQGSGLNEPGPARERGYLGSSHAFPSPSSVRPSRSRRAVVARVEISSF